MRSVVLPLVLGISISLTPGAFGGQAEDYLTSAQAKESSGDIAGAISDITAAMQVRADDATLYNRRGVLRITNGDLDGATTDFTTALRLKPDFPVARDNLKVVQTYKFLSGIEMSTTADPILAAGQAQKSGMIYDTSFGWLNAYLLDSLTPAMAAHLKAKRAMTCIRGTVVPLARFRKEMIGKPITAFYVNLPPKVGQASDFTNEHLRLAKLSDETGLPIGSNGPFDRDLGDALLLACNRAQRQQ